jgi:hypothetical protein
MITPFLILFWFFTALGIAFLVERSKSIQKSWPDGFDLKNNTSFPIGTELRVSTIEKELRDQTGLEPDGFGYFFLDTNHFVSADVVIQKKALELIKGRELFSVSIDSPMLGLSINGSPECFNEVTAEGIPQIINLTISSKVTSFATLSNLHIRSLVLTEHYSIGAMLVINNCWIQNLVIEKQSVISQRSSDPNNMIKIENSYIGILDIGETCCKHFSMSGGGLRGIVCPSQDKQNPFYGSFHLDAGVFLEAKEDTFWFKQQYIQAYRNLRLQIKKFADIESENLLYVQEMRLERASKPSIVRLINIIYDIISSYGTSPERVLTCLGILFSYSSVLFFVYDGATLLESNSFTGWRTILCGNEVLNQASRSIYLSAQSMFNPLYLFSKQIIIEPSDVIFVAWTTIQSLASIILIAVLIITIRRLFKVSQ